MLFLSCKENTKSFEVEYHWESLDVIATAYNALEYQTDNEPHLTAFGDSLVAGQKYIAVSRDLLKLGLTHNTPVKIEGLEGIYWVKDKMHFRWKKRIDIFMGKDIDAARNWGKKRVCITYGICKDTL
ncbi:3D domain-containing protein [Gaetbulibacter aestuarii]